MKRVLLARELPQLGAMIAGATPGRPGQDAAGQVAARRELAARVLAAAQGHPKLLELADGQAAYTDPLEKLLGTADQEWARRGVAPDGLFASPPWASQPPTLKTTRPYSTSGRGRSPNV